ncbi:leucyl/phenylalanyl-tRNA--protein transferase [Bdellovibrionota bacterium FG-1]
MPIHFPDPRKAGPEGLVALGANLEVETLVQAYLQGIFPWPIEGFPEMTWFSPAERGILEFKDLHIPRSLRTFKNKSPYRFTFNKAFANVLQACSAVPRPDQPGTWITPEIQSAYLALHRAGHAHSVEAWDSTLDQLVGGLYGVWVQGVFAGESMFHTEPNASKLALITLIDHLQAHGVQWIDIQMLTPHMKSLGAKAISRDDFLARLQRTHEHYRLNPADPWA